MLKVLGITAAVTTASAVLAGCGGGSSSGGNSGSDATILDSAITAEGLAATLYANLIASPIYTNLSATNRGYLVAAYEQEVEHYNFLVASGGTALPTNTNFYFPTGMFTAGAGGYQTTLNTIEIIEDLLIAIYLIGVNNFSTGSLKLYSAQLLGVDSEHRVLARVVASSLGVMLEPVAVMRCFDVAVMWVASAQHGLAQPFRGVGAMAVARSGMARAASSLSGTRIRLG